MVFPSVNPLYQLDPPTWNQQEQPLVHHQQQFQPVAAPQDGANPGPARANSMAERARAAKIPLPEQALRCPRCDSTNTKFCYFNNYSLTQPRHFCKACRRYWTRGGALRNVPVGGGTRRNNRRSSSKKPSSSSTTTTTSTSAPARQPGAGVSSSSSIATSAAGAAASPLFMTPLHPMMDYGSTSGSSIGLGFSGLDQMELQQQWRLNSQIQNQFPFLGLGGLGLDPQQGIHYPSANTITNYGSECGGGGGGEAVGPTGSDLISTQMASVKMEEQHARGRQYINSLGMNMNAINQRNDQQFWAGVNSGSSSGGGGGGGGGSGSVGGWMTNISGFNSSSTGNLL